MTPDPRTVRLLRAAVVASVALLLLRLGAAERLGWGESEALYASYALYPQSMYLDHPGFIGVLARAIGHGLAPTPLEAHRVTAVLSIAVPWVAAFAARSLGASWAGAATAAIALLVVPETSLGLFAMTPDLPLALAWYAALGLAGLALAAPPKSLAALTATLCMGLAVGVACWSKASGVLLLVGLAITFASGPARHRLRTIAPWAALGVAAVVVAPAVVEEVRRGFPMLHHRLVATQHGAGPSLRNLGAIVGGQLAYIGPPALLAAALVARDLWRRRRSDAVSALLTWTTVASLPLVALAVVSRVAEPHWLAPLFLALPLHLARRVGDAPPLVSRRLAAWCVGWGALAITVVHVAVLTPALPELLGRRYDARADLTNDLYAWKDGLRLVREELEATATDREPAVVVGPHWTVCAQLRAGLPRSVVVGCDGPEPADFEAWVPRAAWSAAPVVLYVTDDRFDVDPSRALADRAVEGIARVGVRRGGQQVRRISVWRMVRATHASADTR